MKDVLVYTAAFYDDDSQLRCLAGSCRELGMDLKMFGQGKGFPGYVNAKVHQHIKFLKEHPSYEYSLYSDASDTFYLRPLERMHEVFTDYGKPMIISAETECYPYTILNIVDRYPEAPTRWRYINSGHIFGLREYVLDRLEWMAEAYKEADLSDSDQSYWSMALLDGELDCEIDSGCKLFQTMPNAKGSVVQRTDGLFWNWETGGTPCAVHFNGRTKGINDAYDKWLAARPG